MGKNDGRVAATGPGGISTSLPKFGAGMNTSMYGAPQPAMAAFSRRRFLDSGGGVPPTGGVGGIPTVRPTTAGSGDLTDRSSVQKEITPAARGGTAIYNGSPAGTPGVSAGFSGKNKLQ